MALLINDWDAYYARRILAITLWIWHITSMLLQKAFIANRPYLVNRNVARILSTCHKNFIGLMSLLSEMNTFISKQSLFGAIIGSMGGRADVGILGELLTSLVTEVTQFESFSARELSFL